MFNIKKQKPSLPYPLPLDPFNDSLISDLCQGAMRHLPKRLTGLQWNNNDDREKER